MQKRISLFSFALVFAAALLLRPFSWALASEAAGELLWAKKFGSGYAAAPSAPLVDGDYLYTMVGQRLYKLDRFSGETVAVSDSADSQAGYGIVPPAIGGGMIFVPLRGGFVQAFDSETLLPLWSTEKAGGQALTPVCYADGNIYFGTWLTEEREGIYYGYSADKSGCRLLWSIEHKGGFYRAGAYVEGSLVTFGSDDGATEGNQSPSAVLYTVDGESGEIISTVEGIMGDIRSSVVGYEGGYVFSTKGGYVYYVKNGEASRVKAGSLCSSTPAVWENYAYVGISDKAIAVVDLEKMQLERTISASGYPNGGIAVRGGRLFTTCNALPGAVYTALLGSDALETVFSPEDEEMQGYCISPISFGDDSTLYYKNDSGYIFALSLSVSVSVEAEEEMPAWLVRKNEGVLLEKITLKKGENILKISADGGVAFIWTPDLMPLTEVIYL